MMCWRSAGSRLSALVSASREEALNPAGRLLPCRAAVSLPESWLVKIAPKIDTPKAPPIVRKNVTPDVAAPRS